MKIVDLTHVTSPDMPVYPGTERPVFVKECSIEDDGFLEKKITMYSHTGTHIDAPNHLIVNSKTLDQLSIGHFHGNAFLLDVSKAGVREIDIKNLKSHEETIKEVEFLLIHTGWSQYWKTDRYFIDFPVFTTEAAEWLSGFGLKGVGFDAISVDKIDSKDFPIHKIFLRRNTVLIENLTNLGELSCDRFTFSCFPLKLEEADGSPVRAVALIQ